MTKVILQPETIEITERVTDPETGALLDATKISIIPEVDAPENTLTTLGALRAKLADSKRREGGCDTRYALDKASFASEQAAMQAQLDQIV